MGSIDAGRRQKGGGWILPLLFVVLIAALDRSGRLPPAVLPAYLASSAAAFLLYAWDKQAARAGRRRIRENTLHLLALLGGWPGAAVAQRVLRHKSQKPSFQLAFITSVVLNCAALAALAANWPR